MHKRIERKREASGLTGKAATLAAKRTANRRGESRYEVESLEQRLLLSGDLFATPYQVPVGSEPASVAAADLNGDGKMDLATANDVSSAVSVLLNQGNGTFAPAVSYAVGLNPHSIVAADFNGDGKPDLVTANAGSNTVSVLLNQGNGTFAAPIDYAVGNDPFSVAAADFNGDGKIDLVTANYGSNTVSVLLNQGNGTFGAAATYDVVQLPLFVTVADFNGDGKPDLATANDVSSAVSVLLNQGNGTFAPAVSYAVGLNPHSIVAADFNGDGKPDLAAPSLWMDSLSVLLNQGSGAFGAAAHYTVGDGPISVTAADFDGDGRPDLAAANSGYHDNTTSVSVLLNQGNGTFAAPIDYAVGSDPFSIAAADLNGDGNPDLVTLTGNSNTVSVLLNQSPPRTQPITQAIAGADEVQLTWSPVPGASGYNVYRGTAHGGESSTPLATNVSATSYLDANVTAGVTYYYTVTAVNGSSESSPSPEASATPFLPIINAAQNGDAINFSFDADRAHIDWTAANAGGRVRIDDPIGLTINGDGNNDTITLDSSNGNPLPNTLHLNGTFTLNGLSGTNPLAGTTVDLSRGSTVYIHYASASSDPLAAIKGYLQNGYNAGAWTGAPTMTTGVITSADAAANPNQLAVGYADSADANSPDTVPDTIELKTTVIGDANLDGSVNLADLLTMVRGFGKTNASWDQGDFNYDGSVNLADFPALTRHFGQSLPPTLSAADVLLPNSPDTRRLAARRAR